MKTNSSNQLDFFDLTGVQAGKITDDVSARAAKAGADKNHGPSQTRASFKGWHGKAPHPDIAAARARSLARRE